MHDICEWCKFFYWLVKCEKEYYHIKKSRKEHTMQLKVAIAEDNKNNLRTIKMLCESEFFSVFIIFDRHIYLRCELMFL